MFRHAGGQKTGFAVDGFAKEGALGSLWGRAPDDVWGAGTDVARWDGTSWRKVDAPPPAPAS